MVGMMKMPWGVPHMMRKPMMKGRINQLLSLTEEKRQESIRDMIGAFHSAEVKDKAREKLVATRVEIVGTNIRPTGWLGTVAAAASGVGGLGV